MKNVLWVGVGGALGSIARYAIAVALPKVLGAGFPYATLFVNALGSFLISAMMYASLKSEGFSPTLRLFLTTGLMGGFTTYSTFNYETLRYFEGSDWGRGALYLLGTVLVCLLCGVLGMVSAKQLL